MPEGERMMHVKSMRRLVSAVGAMVAALAATAGAATVTTTFQTGLNGYTGVVDMELRDPRQGSIGATWHNNIFELAVQEN